MRAKRVIFRIAVIGCVNFKVRAAVLVVKNAFVDQPAIIFVVNDIQRLGSARCSVVPRDDSVGLDVAAAAVVLNLSFVSTETLRLDFPIMNRAPATRM